VSVKSTIPPDDYLRLQILEERTGIPIYELVRRAVKEYVKDVRPGVQYPVPNPGVEG